MTYTERMMQTEQLDELIERLRECSTYGFKQEICGEAADALTKIALDYANLYADNDANLGDLNLTKHECEQIKWERDLAIHQLRTDYGVGLGEKKPDSCTGCAFEPGDRDDYPCTVCRRNPALTDKYEVNSNG